MPHLISMKKYLIILIFFCYHIADAQYSSTNKWRSINTKYFQLIYPIEYESTAQRTAWIHEKLLPYYYKFFKVKKKRKWKIILNNRNMANGFVAPGAPRRSEWYGGILPSSHFEHSEWITGLSIHEGRHMAQFDKSFANSIICIHVIGGESFSAALQSGLLPQWFFEGEAVNFETRFGPRGRGKTPSFDMGFKAIVLSGHHDSYFKAVNPRKNAFYPNWYVYGYFFATYMMKKYGNDFWDKVIERSTKFAFPTWTFQNEILKITGVGISKHYKNMLAELQKIYQQQIDDTFKSPVEILSSTNKRHWLNYESAGQFENGDILVKKHGIKDLEHLVILKPEKKKRREKRLFYSRVFGNIDVEGMLAVWSYSHYNKRFYKERYFDIVLYDHSTKKVKKLTSKKRLYSPSISPDHQKIAAVKYDNGDYDIVLLNLKTGKEIKHLGLKNNQIFSPSWSKDGKQLTYIKATINPFSGTGIYRYHLEEKREELILDGKELPNPSSPVFHENYLFFISSFSGIDTCYAIDLTSREVFQVLSRHYGIYDPHISADGKFLILNDYGGIHGFDVVRIPIEPSEWIPLKKVKKNPIDITAGLDTKEEKQRVAEIWENFVPTNHYRSQKYFPSRNFINIHSWGLMINEETDIGRIDFHISGEDLLNTFSFRLRAGYRLFYLSQLSSAIAGEEPLSFPNIWDGQFSLSITKFFPVIQWRSSYLPIVLARSSYDIWRNSLSVYVPLVDSSPYGVHVFTPSLSITIDEYFNYSNITLANKNQFIAGLSLIYRNTIGRWNHGLTLIYSQSIMDMEVYLLNGGLDLQTPGFFKRDKHLFNIFYQISHLAYPIIAPLPGGIFGNLFSFPFPNQYTGIQYDYRLPLFYPNGGIPHFLFIQTIWIEASFDYSFLKYDEIWDSIGSVGLTAFLEITWINNSYITAHFGFSAFYIFKKPELNYTDNGAWQFIPQFRFTF